MALDFANTRTVEQTRHRMALSVVQPHHTDAYMQSCYGHVCAALRNKSDFEQDDKIVFLGDERADNVVHGVLMRGEEFIVDVFAGKSEFKEGVYHLETTKGAEPNKMYVKGEVSIAEFKLDCLKLLAQIHGPRAFKAIIQQIA